MEDSLKVTQKEDGSFDISWDKDDPTWSFLNELPTAYVEVKIIEYIREEINQKENNDPSQ
jgi:hypothetical protein